MAAAGTSVATMSPVWAKKSSALARSCRSMSASVPSWLAGKIWISTRPSVCSATALAASAMRVLSGWSTGMMLANLSRNSGAARTSEGAAKPAQSADPVSSAPRREIDGMGFLLGLLGPRLLSARRLFGEKRQKLGGDEVGRFLRHPMAAVRHEAAPDVLCDPSQRLQALDPAPEAFVAAQRQHRHPELAV